MHLALGHGQPSFFTTFYGSLPKRIEALRGVRVRSVAAGYEHSCAVTHAGVSYSWGGVIGQSACLGHGEFSNEPVPRRVGVRSYNDV
jgi:alpha-tubulin suppressor-like RCC1 family protein